MLQLDAVQTTALAGLALLLGYGLCRAIAPLARYNMPPPVVGGLAIALAGWLAHRQGMQLLQLDTTLQTPLMVAFFTSIGFNASLGLLRAGGRQIVVLLALGSVLAVLQGMLGAAVAAGFGLHPLFGVLAGTATLAGGPATGLAFAPLFEQAGVAGAASIALASALAGILCGGLLGGPLATVLIRRFRLQPARAADAATAPVATAAGHAATTETAGESHTLKAVLAILLAMWLGGGISGWLADAGITLPAYVGAMLVGAVARNLDDRFGVVGIANAGIERIGAVCLALFLSMALMNLKLWELAGLALPLLVNLLLQAALAAGFCLLVLRAMGRDYQAAVTTGGFYGFMMGTTANAMAVMRALVERYGPAPRAFLVAPLVGAFFIDFSNALVITGFVNLWG